MDGCASAYVVEVAKRSCVEEEAQRILLLTWNRDIESVLQYLTQRRMMTCSLALACSLIALWLDRAYVVGSRIFVGVMLNCASLGCAEVSRRVGLGETCKAKLEVLTA